MYGALVRDNSVFHALLTAGTQFPWFSFGFQCGEGMSALLLGTHKRNLLTPSICGLMQALIGLN